MKYKADCPYMCRGFHFNNFIRTAVDTDDILASIRFNKPLQDTGNNEIRSRSNDMKRTSGLSVMTRLRAGTGS